MCLERARLTSEVLRCFLRSIFADQRRRARALFGIRKGECGAVTFIQRFGSALNLTPHFHTLVLDGVYAGPSHRPGDFAALPPPQTEDVARVLAGTAKRILRLLERRGIDEEAEPIACDDPLMAMLGAASIHSRIALGPEAGQPWRRLGDRVESIEEDESGVELQATASPRCVRQGGMSLHADVAVPARDRQRLERLCRYVARPPLALGRLEALADGRLAYRLKTPWRDGTTHVVMERRELLERLAPLIPPPRAHQVRYHGILAPCASGRDYVVPAGAGAMKAARPGSSSPCSVDGSSGVVDAGGEFDTLVASAPSDLRDEGCESLARRMAWADSTEARLRGRRASLSGVGSG
ncbi:MAG: transposase [Deltaproteobacteria bacterium]|nr:transposase [Deltaproteobacteria bacterium]